MKSYKILLFLLVTALFSCDNDDEETDPCEGINPPPQVRSLVILDSLTGKSLIGNNRLYRPDTIAIYNLFPSIRPSFNSNTLLEIYHGSEDLLGEHLLKLSFNEVDTLFPRHFSFQTRVPYRLPTEKIFVQLGTTSI